MSGRFSLPVSFSQQNLAMPRMEPKSSPIGRFSLPICRRRHLIGPPVFSRSMVHVSWRTIGREVTRVVSAMSTSEFGLDEQSACVEEALLTAPCLLLVYKL